MRMQRRCTSNPEHENSTKTLDLMLWIRCTCIVCTSNPTLVKANGPGLITRFRKSPLPTCPSHRFGRPKAAEPLNRFPGEPTSRHEASGAARITELVGRTLFSVHPIRQQLGEVLSAGAGICMCFTWPEARTYCMITTSTNKKRHIC